jgi:hypothetical protein
MNASSPIAFLEQIHLDGRTEAQLTQSEIAQLQAFIDAEHDRPTNWASHLLCYNYGICRSPGTGDAGAEPKALVRRPMKPAEETMPKLKLKPNPANAWVVVSYDLLDQQGVSQLVVRNALGSTVHAEPVIQAACQVILDTRAFPAGAYAVELLCPTGPAGTERLIIQP